jgi:DNA polymerase-3 subunit epsilon
MEVVKLNGISDAVVAGQPTIKEVLPEIRKRLENRVLIAHNVPFDWAFIDGAIRETLGISLSCPHMCTLHMSRKYLSLTSNSLTSVARHLGVPLVDAHRAEADTLAVVGIFRKMMEILAARGCKVGNDLIRQGILKTAPPVNRR